MTDARSPGPANKELPDAQAKDGVRALAAMPTSEIKLRPSLVDAIRQIAPKQRSSRAPVVVAAVLVAALIAVAATPSARTFVMARVFHRQSPPVTAAAPAASSGPDPWAATVAPQDPVASAPVIAVPSDSPAASTTPGASSSASPKGPTKPGRGPRPPRH